MTPCGLQLQLPCFLTTRSSTLSQLQPLVRMDITQLIIRQAIMDISTNLCSHEADLSEGAQVAQISADAREIWDQLDGVKELREALECVRMQTVIHHVVTRFVERFAHVPNLDLLTDALATNELMKPIKTAQALACKTCTAEQTDGTANQISYYARIRKMKLYNISTLVTHFKLTHQTHGALEWDRELIELPDTPLVGELIQKPGMDDNKLALIADAFPSAFPSPLPHIGTVHESRPDPGPDSGLASRLVKKLTKGQPQGKKKKKGQNFLQDRNGSTPGTDSREEEYDPRRPMFVEKKPAELDPSRFDTDLARKDEPSSNGAPPGTLDLAPETLAALSALQAHATGKPAEPDRRERSLSIRRSESRPASAQHPAPPSGPQITPDIAAILASLTGQTQGAAASATTPSIDFQPRDHHTHPGSPMTRMLSLHRNFLQHTPVQKATMSRVTTRLAVAIPAPWSPRLVTMDKTSKQPWPATPTTTPTTHTQATPSQRPPQLPLTHPSTPQGLPNAPHPATASSTKKNPPILNRTLTTSPTTANQHQSNTSPSPKPECPTATSNTLLRPPDPFTSTSTAGPSN